MIKWLSRVFVGSIIRSQTRVEMAYFVVPTSNGNVKGKVNKTKTNFNYHAFYKIPFAKAPVGDLRFALPQPPDPWTEPRDCSKKVVSTSLQVILMNPESKFLVGSEDCLYLNVFSPQIPEVGKPPPSPLPVIVYIHGGAFCIGSSDPRLYGPEYLVDKGIVYVSVNYRLGPLGFFSLGNDLAPGNQGMHDQVLALEWVQKNIAAFGGDPKNVTIMGESAGAMSCFMHLVSPLSKGLFHKIIALSGSATTPFMHYDRNPALYGQKFAQHFGAKPDITDEEILKHLRSLPANKLIHKTTLFKDWDVVSPMPWKPVIDSYASKSFLPVSFEEAIRNGDFHKDVPLIAGFTSDEGLIFSAPFHKSHKRWDVFFEEWDKWTPLMFFNRETDLINSDDVQAVKKIREKFFPDFVSEDSKSKLPPFDDKHLRTLADIFSTSMFHAPLVHDLNLLIEHGVTVYAYYFSFAGTMTLMELFRLTPFKLMMNFSARHFGSKMYQKELGACHGDDLLYIFPFGVTGFPKALVTESDQNVSRWMTETFTNMAKRGDPNPVSHGGIEVEWKQYEKTDENKKFLIFGNDLACSELNPEVRDRIKFWNVIVKEAGLLTWTKSQTPIPQLHSLPAEKRPK